jgi:hypothetical protein
MVHACAAEDCNVLTMGRFCVEHEQQELTSHRRSPARFATAFVLIAAGVAGATLRVRFMR